MPKVSIIVPVYNAENVLRRCVDSILMQSYDDFELILINDGSKDKSIDIIKEYKEKDNRVIVIDNENNGVSETRNIGVKSAKGKYIQFVDSDDYIDKDMIRKTLKRLEENDADLVMSGLVLNIESKDTVKLVKQTFEYRISNDKQSIAKCVSERLNGTYINSPVNKLYKKSIIVENNIYMDKSIDLGEDLLFNLQYLKHCTKVVFDEACYYHYCMNADESLTFKYREDKLELMEIIYTNCENYFKYCNVDDEELVKLNNMFIKWMYSCFIDFNNINCNLSFSEKIKHVRTAKKKYSYIIEDTANMGLMIRVLKEALTFPFLVLVISKFIYIAKVKFRQILYK